METYYVVKLNNGDKHIIYADNYELENMVHAQIIKEYTKALDNWHIGKIYEEYICTELQNTVNEICRHIQNAKGIKSGDVTPELVLDLDNAIEGLYKAITNIIRFEEKLKEESGNEHNK